MNRIILLVFLLSVVACNNKRTVQLPEIENTKITEILDVSPAYIFYDDSKPDSVELNRRNLISTTNWLVNVDRRLKLSQAIPKIQYIQDKKRNAKMHKNEAARNYYSCNDTSIKSLGFIDFTEVYYHFESVDDYTKSQNIKSFEVLKFYIDSVVYKDKSINLKNLPQHDSVKVFARFDKNMSFQKYINYKEQLIQLGSTGIIIDNDEFIY